MNLLRRIQYCQNWNIGICEQTPDELVQLKQLKRIKWLKHPYRDRWFADPFILRVTKDEIVVFVEECLISSPKGIICELVIDRNTVRIKERYVLLELETHLSYPAIIRYGGKVYVYPENGASGELKLYLYDDVNHRLVNPVCILFEEVADATMLEKDGHWYLSTTKFPQTQERIYLYEASSPFGPFKQVSKQPFQVDRSCSRQGGNFFEACGCLYRPAQNCESHYGAALSIMRSEFNNGIQESLAFTLSPDDRRYSLGLHTINFYDDLCVIDGCGYYYPFWGELYYTRLRALLKG